MLLRSPWKSQLKNEAYGDQCVTYQVQHHQNWQFTVRRDVVDKGTDALQTSNQLPQTHGQSIKSFATMITI
jgi:hypothetical protein